MHVIVLQDLHPDVEIVRQNIKSHSAVIAGNHRKQNKLETGSRGACSIRRGHDKGEGDTQTIHI